MPDSYLSRNKDKNDERVNEDGGKTGKVLVAAAAAACIIQ
jgi:hypothetical protein